METTRRFRKGKSALDSFLIGDEVNNRIKLNKELTNHILITDTYKEFGKKYGLEARTIAEFSSIAMKIPIQKRNNYHYLTMDHFRFAVTKANPIEVLDWYLSKMDPQNNQPPPADLAKAISWKNRKKKSQLEKIKKSYQSLKKIINNIDLPDEYSEEWLTIKRQISILFDKICEIKSIYVIYGLKDPRTNMYFYIGKTKNINQRFNTHKRDNYTNQGKSKIINELKLIGLSPKMEVLETTNEINVEEMEKRWISKGRQEGWPLTNISDKW